jgi:predicted nuclease with TOPRIM domain
MDESRFDRLEQKIDKLTDAVTKIVRVEEQLISNNKRVDRLEIRMDDLEDEVKAPYERIFWIVVTAGVGLLAWFVR